MKARLRISIVLAALIIFVLLCPITAKAEIKITSISLSIDSSIVAGDYGSDVEVTSSSSRYEVEDVEVTNEPDDEWEEGDNPKLKITLTASEGYYFSSSGLTKSNVTLKGDGGTVTSVKRSDSVTFLVYVTLDELEDSAVSSSSEKGSWEESDEWYVTSSEAEEIYEDFSNSLSGSSQGPGTAEQGAGAWLQDDIGWWYCNADKSYTVNNWQYIDGYWYFFDEAGYMKTGWILWQEKWYYCTSSGNMLYDTTTPDGYYVGSDGAWQP